MNTAAEVAQGEQPRGSAWRRSIRKSASAALQSWLELNHRRGRSGADRVFPLERHLEEARLHRCHERRDRTTTAYEVAGPPHGGRVTDRAVDKRHLRTRGAMPAVQCYGAPGW
jgi:hypothetical protein